MSGISRRQALAGLGSISVGALIAACSDDDGSSALEPETNTGTSAEVEPKTSSGDLASQFDDAAACRQTAEETEGPFYFDDSISSSVFLEDPYPGESNRDGFNDSDGLYQRDLELTLSKERDCYLGLITLDVASA